MFTVEQIKTAHSKVRSGADFPGYIKDLKQYWSYLRLLVLSLFTLFFHQEGTAQQSARAILTAKIDRLLQSQVDDGMIPGAVIQVKKDGQTILKKAYGFAQIYDQRHQRLARPEKTSTGHLYDLASLTKVVGTTTSIMLLADRGLFSE